MRLIDERELIRRIAELPDLRTLSTATVGKCIKECRTIDAAEVVRCKDCINRDQAFRCIALYYGFNPRDDWFCANGKRDAEVEG